MRFVPETLPRALTRPLAPAWLVAGDEPLLVGEAADAIRAAARAEGYSGREVLFVDKSFDWGALGTELRSLSLFAERRIVELRMASAKPGTEGSKLLVGALADPAPDVLLLVVAGKIEYADRNAAWVKAFEAGGHCVDAEQLQPEQLPQWIAGRMRAAGLAPEPDAVDLVAERCEGNLVAAHQEIQLLRLLAGPGPLSLDTAEESVATSARYDVFKFGEAMLAGDAPRALRILDGLAAEGEEPTLLLWSVAEELRSVLQYAANPAPRRLFRGGRRRKDLLGRARQRVPAERVWALLGAAGRIDAMIKGSRRDEAWSALARLAAEFCIAGRNRAG